MNPRDFLNFHLFTLSGTPVTVATVAIAMATLVAALVLSKIVRGVMVRTLTRGGLKDAGAIATLDRLVHYGFLLVGFGVALTTLGLDLSALFATGAVAAVAVAFAIQNILQNFVSGLILLAERTITPLDILEVDGQMVRVERMGIRATIARTLDDEEIILPNSLLVQSSVKNLTLADSYFRVRVKVGVAYATDLDDAHRVLIASAAKVVGASADREPVVQLWQFGDSSVVFDVSVWVDDPWILSSVRSRLHFAVWHGLKDAGITIAFPQLDVHVVSNEAGLGRAEG